MSNSVNGVASFIMLDIVDLKYRKSIYYKVTTQAQPIGTRKVVGTHTNRHGTFPNISFSNEYNLVKAIKIYSDLLCDNPNSNNKHVWLRYKKLLEDLL